ncbi:MULTISPECIES: hypothetical protein [Bradyrhizobium]|uniref:Uncharacterized protein n=1 Tax=Bradyrhizobium elkanii TaxID=29448 RepID=A0A4U6S125_BRAEL|nr:MULTISPECIES: hypothetical protein [Bradyrhizobium]MTV15465.1 hypothetical protein [Bradyrhizobium sp. BR2003]TKV81189.1 hypothetical protein FDV58_13780 [Bradyrhizobium elkanii]
MRYLDQPEAIELAVSPPKRTCPPCEQVDEAREQLEKQEVEIERELPLKHDQSIERIQSEERQDPPMFAD